MTSPSAERSRHDTVLVWFILDTGSEAAKARPREAHTDTLASLSNMRGLMLEQKEPRESELQFGEALPSRFAALAPPPCAHL